MSINSCQLNKYFPQTTETVFARTTSCTTHSRSQNGESKNSAKIVQKCCGADFPGQSIVTGPAILSVPFNTKGNFFMNSHASARPSGAGPNQASTKCAWL